MENQVDLLDFFDDEIEDPIAPNSDLVVFSRDWTIQTIVSQITQGNIDLNPKYQRRNAWKDDKRLRLIESLLLQFPVPEIVLAERTDKKRSFVVLDGKQRLQTLVGLYHPLDYKIWDSDKFPKSSSTPQISGVKISEFLTSKVHEETKRLLDNSDIRCTIISNYASEDILFDIFYRLNTGSTPLSSQELRQVLNKGEFSDFLLQLTSTSTPIHLVLGIEKADNRLIDVDLILRCLAFKLNGNAYKGNQKMFLDNFLKDTNAYWESRKDEIKKSVSEIFYSINFLAEIIEHCNIGRKIIDGRFDSRFNKVLFEAQVLFSLGLDISAISPEIKERFTDGLSKLMQEPDFRMSLESTTKSLERYRIRFNKYRAFMNSIFGSNVKYNCDF